MKIFTEQNIADMKSLSDYVKTHGSYTSSVEQIKEVFGPAVKLRTLYGRLREFGIGRKVTGSEVVFVDTVRSYVHGDDKTPFSAPEATIPTPDLSICPFPDKSAPEAAETLTVITEPMLIEHDGEIYATSKNVAEVFGKEHGKVLKTINEMTERGQANFGLTYYKDESNRQSKMYEMNRDGLVFLVSKFTGEKAENLILDYIELFNKMENELRSPAIPATTGNPLVDALVSMQLEQNQMNSRLDALEVKVDDVVALPAAKAIRTIPTGYTSISSYTNKRPGLSRDVIKLLITIGSIGVCEYDKVVEGYGVVQEVGYNIYDLDVIANKVIAEAVRVHPSGVYFTSPTLGTKQFKISF